MRSGRSRRRHRDYAFGRLSRYVDEVGGGGQVLRVPAMDTLARVASERSKGLDAIEHQSDHLALSC
jgi:hypothetical protein